MPKFYDKVDVLKKPGWLKIRLHRTPEWGQVRQIVESEPLTLGEDFAIYLQELPGVFWTLGVRPPEAEEMCPLHNPGMAPDERAIRVGIDMLVATGLRFLKKG